MGTPKKTIGTTGTGTLDQSIFHLKGYLSMSYETQYIICGLEIWCFRLKNMVFLRCKYGVFFKKEPIFTHL